MALIEVRLTSLARPMTLTLTYDLDLQYPGAMVMTYSHAKVQGKWSVGAEDRVKTNGRTDGQR